MLDATLGLVLDGGASTATIAAIANASGAPTGSIYHAFESREDLLARMWIRAARRSQARFLEAAHAAEPRTAARTAAMSIFDFAREQLADARLLASMRLEDLLRTPIDPSVARELQQLNRPVERTIGRLAARLAGETSRNTRQMVALATIDLPHGAVRRHLVAGRRPPIALRAPLEHAVSAVINAIEQGDHSDRNS